MYKSNKSSFLGLLPLVAALCLAVLSGCTDIRNIRISQCRIVSISPRGLSSLDATVSVDLFNPGAGMTLYDMEAWIREDGRDLLKLTAPSVIIAADTTGRYEVVCSASLQGGLSLFDVRNLISERDFSTYYVDISLYQKTGNGKGRPVKINRMPLKKLLGQ